MDNKLILIEGIPGAGKTTTAGNLLKELTESGKKVNMYTEGMSHPADFAWQAVLNKQEYESFIKDCTDAWDSSSKSIDRNSIRSLIEKQTRIEEPYYIVAYTQIPLYEEAFQKIIGPMNSKEICDGRSSFNQFRDLHLARWSKFARDNEGSDVINIFECAFLQNHIFELMGFYEKTDEEIMKYLKDLISTVKSLNPLIVYIKPESVENIIEQAAKERVSPDHLRPDWIDEMSDWVAGTNYGKHHDLKGREGVISYCSERLRLDMLALNSLGTQYKIIERR